MEFIPAIDLIDGECVRLIQGDFERKISYGSPEAAAREIQSQGASWLHLVDLDAARSNRKGVNREVIAKLSASSSLRIEVGGGVRSVADAEKLFEVGVERVILGTMAVQDPSLIEEISRTHPGGVVVGLDYRRVDGLRQISVKGWTQASGLDLFEILPRLIDCGAVAAIVTDISRDGTFSGPDLETLEELLEFTSQKQFQIIASGGVSNLEDIRRLKNLRSGDKGVFGVISGRAIHDGRIDIKEAVALCQE